jgi:5-methyltetrahydrofolate--homocysteine methyltransferase
MTKNEFYKLFTKSPVLLDGATGSNLMKRGTPRGVCTESWVAEHPEVIVQLQQEYAAAGSQIIYAPTFSANRHSLARHGLEAQVAELNRKLVQISKKVEGVLVAGDMTTTGVPVKPLGTMSYNTLLEIYKEQAQALAEAGADLIVVETMLGIEETAAALEAISGVCALPVLCSVSIQADGGLYFGGTCFDAVKTFEALGASAVGINCSLGPEQLLSIVRNLKELIQIPLLIKPNAGMPTISHTGDVVYPMGPEDFAARMLPLIQEGADLVGGCCGTSPAHIAALKKAMTEA